MLTDIRCASPWPIELQSSKIELVRAIFFLRHFGTYNYYYFLEDCSQLLLLFQSPYINFVDDDFETQIEGSKLLLIIMVCSSPCPSPFNVNDTNHYGVFTDTDTQIPIGICVDVRLCAVWTPPHNSIQPNFYRCRCQLL